MPIIKSQFKPAWWLRNAHAQTLWNGFVRNESRPQLESQRLELPDGDFIDLFWSGPKNGRHVLLLHGLEGSMDSNYAKGLISLLTERGCRSCLMHFRNCGGVANRLPESYHSGKTSDPQLVVDFLRDTQDIAFFAAIGISLGGNILLKWLGEMGDKSCFERAAVMSVPFRLDLAARRMGQGFSKIYQRFLVGKMQRSYKNKFAGMQSPLDVNVDELDTFWLFDDQVTAALHGFENVHDYYRRSSSRQFIPKIKTPTLILHAKDDPFMFPESAPTAAELPENVWLELTDHGGHVAFISGNLPGWANYWGEQRVADWLCQSEEK